MGSTEENLDVRTGSTTLFFKKDILLPSFGQWKPVLTGCN
jgi:hypothetical protein